MQEKVNNSFNIDNKKQHLSKNMFKALNIISANQSEGLEGHISALKQAAFVKFDSTMEVSIKLGIDPKQSSQSVRGIVSLPSGTGKSVRVAVVCKDSEVAKSSGADVYGSMDLVDLISAGEINFDVCICTPDMMGSLGRVAKILGPKGLMPNPRMGTVTLNVAEAVQKAKSGQVEFRSDKGGVINSMIGKVSFTVDALEDNIISLLAAVLKAKPSGLKGDYIKSVFLSSTMSPSIRCNLLSLLEKVNNKSNSQKGDK